MNRHCIQCKHFIQHYFINECMRLCDIYKVGHCNKSMIKDGKLKICKEWSLADKTCKKAKEKHKIESVINKIHAELDELILIYNLIKKELSITKFIE